MHDDNLEPVKYSFARSFPISEDGEKVSDSTSLGGKQCRTDFPLAFLHAMQHYQETHEKILVALNDTSDALVSSLKKETVS